MKYEYDVFISSKSEDYDMAEDVYNFLTSHGLRVFFADYTLKGIAGAKYVSAINDALATSDHFVLTISSLEHYASWVKYECETFLSLSNNQGNKGAMICVMGGSVTFKNIPTMFASQQSFLFEDYQKKILTFLQNVVPIPEPNPDPDPHPEIWVSAVNKPNSKLCTLRSLVSVFNKGTATVTLNDLLKTLATYSPEVKKALKDDWGVNVEMKDWNQCRTVGDLRKLINERMQQKG